MACHLVIKEVGGRGGREVRDEDDVGVPGVDLLHRDDGVGVVCRHGLGDVPGADGVAPVLAEEVAPRSDDLAGVVAEEEENLAALLGPEVLRAVGDHLRDGLRAAVDQVALALVLGPDLGEALHPLGVRLDDVVVPLARADAEGGNARVADRVERALVGRVDEDEVGPEGHQGLDVEARALHEGGRDRACRGARSWRPSRRRDACPPRSCRR